ncbi:hypothetical protein QTV43_000024 [Vibrio vulnificus]|nr:hypothetical protein [Vibrio vulnificus]
MKSIFNLVDTTSQKLKSARTEAIKTASFNGAALSLASFVNDYFVQMTGEATTFNEYGVAIGALTLAAPFVIYLTKSKKIKKTNNVVRHYPVTNFFDEKYNLDMVQQTILSK